MWCWLRVRAAVEAIGLTASAGSKSAFRRVTFAMGKATVIVGSTSSTVNVIMVSFYSFISVR